MFCLRLFDTPLIRFDLTDDPLTGQVCHILYCDETKRDLFPIGLSVTDKGLLSFLRNRFIPGNRAYVDAILSKNGLSRSDTRGLLRISKGLSLNDSYWITEGDEPGSFSDYDLYHHPFRKVLSLIAYTGYGSQGSGKFSSSPEFTTGGMLRKGWRRIGNDIVLYKGGTEGAANTGNEPYSEFYASEIARRMGINAIPYGLSMWKKSLCSTCVLFSDIDHAYVPIWRFVPDYDLRTVSVFLDQLGPAYYDAFCDMVLFDALIFNEDRHFGNFGLMVDSHTNQPYAFAPLFDHGLSLFNYGMPDDFNDLSTYASTRISAYGVPFDAIAKQFITKRQKEKLKKLIGFHFERHSRYNLPAGRLRSIERFMQLRVQQLLSL